MAWKQLNQMTFVDELIHEHEAIKELDEIHELIDWKQIENRLININNKETGVRAWPPLMMFKILLLQSFYNLSDPACEKQLARDLLFRRFVCLSLVESVPDHSTIWRFRNQLQELGLLEELFKEINEQLSSPGI